MHDPLKFSDLNHDVKRDPETNMRSVDNNWDFWTLLPEALHQVMIVMSDRGIPASCGQSGTPGSWPQQHVDDVALRIALIEN